MEELREQLADIEHQRWADWQKWCHQVIRENFPSEATEAILKRWDRQIATPYKDLSEKEKDSDREQVDRYLPLINRACNQARIDLIKELKEQHLLIVDADHKTIRAVPLSVLEAKIEGLERDK